MLRHRIVGFVSGIRDAQNPMIPTVDHIQSILVNADAMGMRKSYPWIAYAPSENCFDDSL